MPRVRAQPKATVPPLIAFPVAHSEPWPIDRLVPYEKNPKVHPPEQVAQIVASMRQFGWTIPVLIDPDGKVIAGHGRLQAAREIGLTSVPVLIARGWSDDQKRAYIIADNRLTEGGAWDADLLRGELADLFDAGFDMTTLGYSAAELDAAMQGWAVSSERVDGTAPGITGNLSVVSVKCTRAQEAAVRDAVVAAMAPFEGVEIK